MPMPRYYYESDGDGPVTACYFSPRAHYVIDRYACPCGPDRRRDVRTRKEGRKLARELNANPTSAPWDTYQAELDNYQG